MNSEARSPITTHGAMVLPGQSLRAIPALRANHSRAQPSVKEAYERKVGAFAERIASLLDGDRSDRERRPWSILALMVGAITLSRAMPEQTTLGLIDTEPS